MKYNTVEQIIESFKNGDLDVREDTLMIDNDTCFIYKNDVQVFTMSPGELLCELLDYLEIPSEGV